MHLLPIWYIWTWRLFVVGCEALTKMLNVSGSSSSGGSCYNKYNSLDRYYNIAIQTRLASIGCIHVCRAESYQMSSLFLLWHLLKMSLYILLIVQLIINNSYILTPSAGEKYLNRGKWQRLSDTCLPPWKRFLRVNYRHFLFYSDSRQLSKVKIPTPLFP